MADKEVRLRVGVAVDANASAVLAPIERAVKRTRKTIEQEMQAAAKGAAAATKQGVTSQEASWKKLEREVEREAQRMLREQERTAKQAAREVDKSERDKTRSIQRESRERMRAERDAAREAKRLRDEEARRPASIWNRPITGPSQWGHGGQIGIGRRAGISVSRGAALGFGLTGAALSSAAGVAREVGHGLGYETSFEEAIRQSQQQKAVATQISNAGFVPGSALVNPNDILKGARSIGNTTGTGTAEVLEALQNFVAKTGDLQTAQGTMERMAILSKATGSSLADMADAAAEVSNHLGDIPDKAAVTSKIMQQIAGQGKLGAVEIRDLASQMAKIAASANQFRGGAATNIAVLGAMAQESKLEGGSASSSQAATAVMRFAQGFSVSATLKHWKERGLTPFTDKSQSQLADPREIILGALRYASSKTPNHLANQAELKQLFPSSQGYRAVAGFEAVFNRAGGGESGLRAVSDEFDRLLNAQLADEEMMRAFAETMKQSKSTAEIFNNQIQETAGQLMDALLPAVQDLAPIVVDVAKGFTSLVDKFFGNRELDVANKAGADAGTREKHEEYSELLKRTNAKGQTEYSQEALDLMQADVKKRAEKIAEIQPLAEQSQKDAAPHDLTDPMTGEVIGQELQSPKLVNKSARESKLLDDLRRDQSLTQQYIKMVHDAIEHQTAVLVKQHGDQKTPKPRPGAPADADVDKD